MTRFLSAIRTRSAIAAGKTARSIARLRGSGSALPGLVVEKIDPQFLQILQQLPRGIVVVTGTNGKTTTTKMLVALLRAHGLRVLTNPTGSNFTRGVISALLPEVSWKGQIPADIAVLELDEAYAIHFSQVIAPDYSLLLNVARDQLDRFAEIDYTARLLADLAAKTTQGVVFNQDDSFVARGAQGLATGVSAHYFGVHSSLQERLSELMEQDLRSEEDFLLPSGVPGTGLLQISESGKLIVDFPGEPAHTVGPVSLQQLGLAAMINATAATTMAVRLLGSEFSAAQAEDCLAAVRPAFGRGEVIDIAGQPLELVLVKNPAGFSVAMSTYGTNACATMIAINDNYADGRDVSWLYDVSFTSLRSEGVAVCSGVRAYDMAVRLEYDEVPVGDVQPDLRLALEGFLTAHKDGPMRIFSSYTAMLALRAVLAEKYAVPEMGTENSL